MWPNRNNRGRQRNRFTLRGQIQFASKWKNGARGPQCSVCDVLLSASGWHRATVKNEWVIMLVGLRREAALLFQIGFGLREMLGADSV